MFVNVLSVEWTLCQSTSDMIIYKIGFITSDAYMDLNRDFLQKLRLT